DGASIELVQLLRQPAHRDRDRPVGGVDGHRDAPVFGIEPHGDEELDRREEHRPHHQAGDRAAHAVVQRQEIGRHEREQPDEVAVRHLVRRHEREHEAGGEVGNGAVDPPPFRQRRPVCHGGEPQEVDEAVTRPLWSAQSPSASTTDCAIAASCTPTPVRSATVISLALSRPGSRPAARSPSSAYTLSRRTTPAAMAWCRLPYRSVWNTRSATSLSARASNAGSSSIFSGLPVPTEVTCVPGPTHDAITSGVVLAVAVTITRWSRTADSSAGAMRVSTA